MVAPTPVVGLLFEGTYMRAWRGPGKGPTVARGTHVMRLLYRVTEVGPHNMTCHVEALLGETGAPPENASTPVGHDAGFALEFWPATFQRIEGEVVIPDDCAHRWVRDTEDGEEYCGLCYALQEKP